VSPSSTPGPGPDPVPSSPSFLPHPCPAGSHQGTQLNSANLQKFEFEIFIYLLSDKGGQRWGIESVKFVRYEVSTAAKRMGRW